MLTPYTFVSAFLLWEGMYWASVAALNTPRARAALTPVVCRDAPAYVVSTVHAVFAAARGARHLLRLWAAPSVVKLCVPPPRLVTPAMDVFLAEAASVVVTNVSLAGYLTSDLVHVLWRWPDLGKMDTVMHHVAFLSCALVAGRGLLFPFMFGWLIVGEASTPILNLRWYLIRQGHGDSRMLSHVSKLFAAVFFVTRFCVYGAGLVHLVRTYGDLPKEVSGVSSAAVTLFTFLGFALNLVWLQRIARIAAAPPRPKASSTKAGLERAAAQVAPPAAAAETKKDL
jgi:hypothetical protein